MNQEAVLAVLQNNPEAAKSMREIAHEIGLDISSHSKWIKAERSLSRILRKLVKWGWVACDCRQNSNGHRFWYNAYWRTELGTQKADMDGEFAVG